MKDSDYQMAKDIFSCHLGLSETEIEEQLAQIFSPADKMSATQSTSTLIDPLLNHLNN